MSESGSRRKFFQLRVWYGMTATVWLRLLVRNRFRISPSRFFLVALISVASVGNSVLAFVQRMILGRRIDRVRLPEDPVFILGHWRSGTTLLHQLLTLDSRHTFASTYACFAPSHFLISEKFFVPWLRFLLPLHRPQDNVRVDLSDPQEDEWAICCLGQPSPYLAAAFPNNLPHDSKYFDFVGVTKKEVASWKHTWCRFLKSIQLRAVGKRMVIKSPLHTARVELLLAIFPKARFVHVVRDPHAVYPSTMRLWERLSEDEGLQVPTGEGLDEFVLDSYERMYRSFGRCRDRIRAERLCQVGYEELIGDPVGTLRSIYDHLDLGDFEAIQDCVESFTAEQSSFQTNRYAPSQQDNEKITQRWGEFVEVMNSVT